jgi:hypothetical protein
LSRSPKRIRRIDGAWAAGHEASKTQYRADFTSHERSLLYLFG